MQSVIAIKSLVENGIHNTVKRELRYLIEMMTKYVIVDYVKMGKSFNIKTNYLKENIPNSSIEIIDQYTPPLSADKNEEFKAEVKDFFIKRVVMFIHQKNKLMNKLKITIREIILVTNLQKCLQILISLYLEHMI